MAMELAQFNTVINKPLEDKCTASVIFLHGTGGTGVSLRDGIRERVGYDFSFPHIKVIFPTAPLICIVLLSNPHYTPKECCGQMITAEVNSGIPKHRIVIVGFSMGASMALHLGLRFEREVAGIVSLSTFLYQESEVYKMLEREKINRLPPILHCHGDKDALVDHEWGLETAELLKQLGLKDITFHTIPGLKHTVNKQELEIVKAWIMDRLPEE